MTDFTFDEKTHRYYLDGKPMTGVTTVLGVINKPMLLPWASKMACEYVKENLHSMDELDAVLELAKNAHTRKRDSAAEAGTDVHAECERYIRDCINNGELVDYHVKPDGDSQLQHFMDWAIKNKVIFTASEEHVYSASLFVGGTFDFTCEMDGLKYVGDIKTSSSIYGREPFAQTAAYQFMISEMAGKKPEEIADRRLIINLKKTGTFDEDKDVYISEHYEDDIELFMSALTMYRNVGRFEPLNYLAKRKQ